MYWLEIWFIRDIFSLYHFYFFAWRKILNVSLTHLTKRLTDVFFTLLLEWSQRRSWRVEHVCWWTITIFRHNFFLTKSRSGLLRVIITYFWNCQSGSLFFGVIFNFRRLESFHQWIRSNLRPHIFDLWLGVIINVCIQFLHLYTHKWKIKNYIRVGTMVDKYNFNNFSTLRMVF